MYQNQNISTNQGALEVIHQHQAAGHIKRTDYIDIEWGVSIIITIWLLQVVIYIRYML